MRPKAYRGQLVLPYAPVSPHLELVRQTIIAKEQRAAVDSRSVEQALSMALNRIRIVSRNATELKGA
jgi:hypothetical protein